LKSFREFATLRLLMRDAPLAPGEMVMLVDERGRRLLKSLVPRHRITVRGTVLRCDDIIGRPEGARVGEGEPESFLVFRPSHAQFVPEIERPAEPIFAKDVGAIVVHADIRAGDHVVEFGTGAGAMSIALLRTVGSAGRVTSYEVRADFAAEARKNVERFQGVTDNWRLHVGDPSNGTGVTGADVVVIDVPDPVPLLAAAAASLRPGGGMAVYLPTVLQLKELRDALAVRRSFALIETLEVLERTWHADARSLRPSHRMVAHTAFLTFARRTAETNHR
jgi:tRNA (adenine57-N1/adenine58-N1)-methyltransferase